MIGRVRLSDVVGRLEENGLLVAAPDADPILRGISDDSRRTAQGDLFCAWAGVTSDAHGFVPAAERAGAAAALVERTVEGVRLPQVVVQDGRRAAAIGAALLFGDPQDALKLVAVTGTNGKTTTVWLLRHLLGLRWAAASIGTLGTIMDDGSVLPGSEALTTPGPVDTARLLATLAARGTGAVAMEVSSHALHQGRVAALHFDAAVFTNLSRDHLDYHGTLEDYLAAKLLLVDRLRADAPAIVNADDPAWSAVHASRVMTFGMAGHADVRAEDVTYNGSGAHFTCVANGERRRVSVPLPGLFNVHNALGALAACLTLGLDFGALVARIAEAPQVPGRLEVIATTPCPVLRDYAHTPDALERVLLALRPLTSGRLIVVFGAGGDRDRGKRPEMGAAAQAHADVAIVTSDNPRTEDPDRIVDDIVAGMRPGYERIVDRRSAIAHALEIARADDIVLLAGKGHETYQIIGTEAFPFDERAIISELLASGGAA